MTSLELISSRLAHIEGRLNGYADALEGPAQIPVPDALPAVLRDDAAALKELREELLQIGENE